MYLYIVVKTLDTRSDRYHQSMAHEAEYRPISCCTELYVAEFRHVE